MSFLGFYAKKAQITVFLLAFSGTNRYNNPVKYGRVNQVFFGPYFNIGFLQILIDILIFKR